MRFFSKLVLLTELSERVPNVKRENPPAGKSKALHPASAAIQVPVARHDRAPALVPVLLRILAMVGRPIPYSGDCKGSRNPTSDAP